MKITAKAIFEYLQEWVFEVKMDEGRQFSFEEIRLLTGEERSFLPDVLYICADAFSGVSETEAAAEACFLIKKKAYKSGSGAANAIVLKDSCHLSTIINDLLTLFETGRRFSESLQDMVITNTGLDEIFKMARGYFPGCLIVMTDTAYNITHTTDQHVEDLYLDKLLSRGYYDKSDIDKIADHGYFEDMQRVLKPVRYSAEVTVSGKSMLLRSYLRSGFSSNFIACYFLKGEPTEFDCLMFEKLTNCIEIAIQNNRNQNVSVTFEEQLVADLLNAENQENEALLQDRCMRLGIPYQCNFRIGVIQTESPSENKAINIAKQLSAYCPVKNLGVFKYRTNVIVVFYDWNYYTVKETSALEENFQALISTLHTTKSRMGISLGFKSMESFQTGYQQATRIISTANSSLVDGADSTVLFYSSWYLQDMLTEYEKVMPLDSVYIRQLDALNDRKYNENDDLTVLYVFLRTERNISVTARKLNMHRNGMIYRINKIVDQLDLNLEDADTRLRLLISFEVLKRLGKFKVDNKIRELEEGQALPGMQKD